MFDSLPRSTPESVGIPSESIRKTLYELKKLDSLNSLMILRHGHVCAEGWWKPYAPEIRHTLYSLSKSFTSAAIGLAQSEGKLNIGDRLISFFPEYESSVTDPYMRSLTLRNLLTMATGHTSCIMRHLQNDPEGNYVKAFLSSALPSEPGKMFVYNSGATYMLAAVVRKMTGENVREYLIPRLFEPLGIIPGIWECCPKGTNLGGWGFHLKTEDIAKFAQLLLDEGRWNGKQLLPADYLREATAVQIDTPHHDPDWKCGYGYQFWQSQHGYRGDGSCGQYAIVLPKYDIAIAITSGLKNMQQILTELWTNLLPAVKADLLPENPEENLMLKAELDALCIPAASGNLEFRTENIFWNFMENPSGIRSLSVSFGAKDCTLVFNTVRGTERIHAGFGFFECENSNTFLDSLPHRGAASAAWLPDGTLEIQVCNYETPYRDSYRINMAEKKFERISNIDFLHPPLGKLEVI